MRKVPSDQKFVKISITLPPEVEAYVQSVAAHSGGTVSKVISEIIEREMGVSKPKPHTSPAIDAFWIEDVREGFRKIHERLDQLSTSPTTQNNQATDAPTLQEKINLADRVIAFKESHRSAIREHMEHNNIKGETAAMKALYGFDTSDCGHMKRGNPMSRKRYEGYEELLNSFL